MASLAAYLLKLAEDPNEVSQFRTSAATARARMTAAGLSNDQQETLLSCDSQRISKAVSAELGPGDPDGFPIPMVFCTVCPSS
jgi:hypothetical protein